MKLQRLRLHTLSVFYNSCMRHFPVDFRSPHSLPTASVCDSNVLKATRRLGPSKSVGLDSIPAFFIKSCLDALIPVLKLIFNLSLS